MGLVGYSDSESSASESEVSGKSRQPKTFTSKQSFQKVVDRSKPGTILVNLPDAKPETPSEPPTKRARTSAPSGGGRFSGFNSFLPAPKKQNAVESATTSSGVESNLSPGIHLKTSAAPGFSRDVENNNWDAEGAAVADVSTLVPKKQTEPSILKGQKAAEDVKLVGRPMLFKPLSVIRDQKKKKVNKAHAPKPTTPTTTSFPAQNSNGQSNNDEGQATVVEVGTLPPPTKKTSLFSMHTDEPTGSSIVSVGNGVYEPLFQQELDTGAYEEHTQHSTQVAAAATTRAANDVDAIADDLQLDAAARRELFGRGGKGKLTAKEVINFNMDKEYRHNEALRALGEQQIHNPVRAIHGGKGSLRSLVSSVQNQREALEDSFAKGKLNRKEAASRYGW